MAKRPKCIVAYNSMAEVEDCAKRCGSHWFDPSSKRFFRSRVGDTAYADGRGGAYFVSSEQFVPSRGPAERRLYSVRYYNPDKCSIETVGKFQQYGSLAQAKRVAKAIAEKSKSRKRGYRMRKRWWLNVDTTPPTPGHKYERIRGAW